MRFHFSHIFLERAALIARDDLALAEPNSYCSITIDSKAPPLIPHFARIPKSLLAKKRVRFHIFGLINFGLNIFEYKTFYSWWSSDANLGISLLWGHIRSLLLRGLTWDTLYLHADNCARDNKNQWMFAFLSLMVKKNYFRTIELHFLPPGHSHEKVK